MGLCIASIGFVLCSAGEKMELMADPKMLTSTWLSIYFAFAT